MADRYSFSLTTFSPRYDTAERLNGFNMEVELTCAQRKTGTNWYGHIRRSLR